MVKCANCAVEALYTYQISGTYHINYCQYHLPKFLFNQRNTGQLALVSPVTEEPVSKVSKKKIEEPVVEEPVAEEVIVEESTGDDAVN